MFLFDTEETIIESWLRSSEVSSLAAARSSFSSPERRFKDSRLPTAISENDSDRTSTTRIAAKTIVYLVIVNF